MNSGPIIHIVRFVLLLLFQMIVAKNLVLFGEAFAFPYLLFLLLLPVNSDQLIAMMLGFMMGFSVDLFYNTGGMHAAASVLIMTVRKRWLNMITPQGGYDMGQEPSFQVGGFLWFLGYALPLILVHHISLFLLEAYGFAILGTSLTKAILSSIFTFVLCVVLMVLTGRNKRK